MTDLVVRRLLIDLKEPFARRWNGDDAFRSAWLNSLSMGFPVGEQMFIDSLRDGLKALPESKREYFASEIQGFVGQEATHRHLHALYNKQLDAQGFVNSQEKRMIKRLEKLDSMKLDPRHAVAITAATEHFTAIFAGWMLETPQNLQGADPRLKTLWLWHSAEETEHRCIAFDLYRALGGNEKWRLFWFRFVTVQFMTEIMRQTVRNLWDDKALFSWRTWRSAASMMLGQQGLVRYGFKHWRAYFAKDFHPSHQDATSSEAWLRDNEDLFRVIVRAPA